MNYCFDTNTIIYYLKGQYPGILQRLRAQVPESILIPEIVRAELLYGVAKSQQREANAKRVQAFLEPFTLLPFAGPAVEHYADIRIQLEGQGQVIGPNDLMIAATVRAYGATLVTHNIKEFKRVPALNVEDWTLAL